MAKRYIWNSKFEIRNSKQIRISNSLMSKTIRILVSRNPFGSFEFKKLENCFEFWYSDFWFFRLQLVCIKSLKTIHFPWVSPKFLQFSPLSGCRRLFYWSASQATDHNTRHSIVPLLGWLSRYWQQRMVLPCANNERWRWTTIL